MQNLITVLISLLVLIAYIIFPNYPQEVIVFFDVKQGDSMLYQNGNIQIIIDAGGGDYLVQRLGYYMPILDNEVEYLVITHMHGDHFAGVFQLFEEFNVKNVVLPASLCKFSQLENSLLESIKKEGSSLHSGIDILIEGNHIQSFRNTDTCGTTNSEVNNTSIITLFDLNGFTVLNMGDAEKEAESKLDFKNIDVLKAGHHCSDTSSSENFLKKVDPKFAICSFGEDNNYGHPSMSLLDLFDSLGVRYISTAQNGDIIILKNKLIYNQSGKLLGEI